ncbi:MAG TPA: ABC transporter permease, partial [Bryobacteraceae bacterium]|nr:ABC transporter permease [Bryobacteraceae bacterium]
RMMRKSPGFTLVAVLSLALGIGVNSAMFSLADAVLFRPLGVAHPGEVVTILGKSPSGSSDRLSYRDYVDFRDRSQSFAGMVAFKRETFGFSADPRNLPQMRLGMLVSGNFFQAMGIQPALGRGFRPDEDQVPGRDAVVILGHDFWEKQLGADAAIVGRKVRLDGFDFTVIGVAPERFTGMDQYIRPAMFVPLAMAPRLSANPELNLLEKRSARALEIKGRLAPGVTMAHAQADLAAIAKSLEQTYPDTDRDQSAVIVTEFQTRLRDDPDDAVLTAMLLGLSAMVLLVACANIANLLLSRARSRTREIAIRLAVGAGRSRLIRQLLAESLAIAVAGGAVSLLLAYAGVSFFLSHIQVPSDFPIVIDVRLDYRVLLFSMAISLVSVMLFGLAPALQATRTELVRVLKSEDADRTRGKRLWGRQALVVVQVALSLVLMAVAAMLARGFAAVLAGGPGFRTDHLVMMSLDPTLVLTPKPQAQQFYKELMDRARTTPGVKSATLVSGISFSPNQRQGSIIPEGYQFPKQQNSAQILANWVDDRFFDTMRVPIVRGRGFRHSDLFGGPRAAVINEVLARHYWPGQDPVGKRFRLTGRDGQWVQIVGIAQTAKYTWVGEPPTEYLYLALDELPRARMTLVAESFGDPAGLVAPLREVVRGLDANQPVFDVRTIQDLYQARASVAGMINEIVAVMGLVGLGLAMVGLYGLIAYSVARRTREIGIRMAIGADRKSVMGMVLRQGLLLSVTGIAIGLVASIGAEKVVMTLFGATRRDVLAYVLVAPALLAVTMLAVWVPARRASLVDPIRALRYE